MINYLLNGKDIVIGDGNVIKKDVYNAKIRNIQDKVLDITNLAANTTLNAKINGFKSKIPSITNLAATPAPTTIENKIPNISDLIKKED